MITLFTGSPGAGKTASMVDYLSKLDGNRPLFVDGINGLTIPHTPIDASRWHLDLPDGAILAVDEVQRHWRARSSGAKVPDAVQEMETHRHRGIDMYFTTQSPAQIDVNVRNLVGRHVHIRNTGVLGRYWYEWPETSTGMNWKTCVNKRRFTLPKKAFGLYKSSSLHTKPEHGIPRSLIVGLVALLVLSILVFMTYRIINRTQTPQQPAPMSIPSGTPGLERGAIKTVGYERGSGPIDDRVDFVPRVSSKPESAPAYDHLRQIAVMPVVVAGYCQGDYCRCNTQQGTDSGMSTRECREWMRNPPFNPYPPRQIEQVPNKADNQPAMAAPVPPAPSAAVRAPLLPVAG